ncbi:MAG TPA: 50S ribosomal protein L18 [Candidatus Saccharimonadales bacterium]|nr:50S ribosomal protein L18 [Candidatus Saccharimonadales bacterium]
MNSLKHTRERRLARARRVRAKITGTNSRPRLSVHISHRHVSAQLIDDEKNSTVAYATTAGQKTLPKTLTEKSELVGGQIAELANKAKIKKATLDRGSRMYHGHTKALAEAARKAGLEI